MPNLDIFRNDAFSLASLTDAILKRPYQPGRVGALGLFRERPISTTSVIVEEKNGRLSLIQSSKRGGPGEQLVKPKRTARAFVVPHLERDSTIYAEEVQNVRGFGSETELEAVQAVSDEHLTDLRRAHEVTLERHRVSALQGILLDADGSTLYNFFTEFGVSQNVHEIDLTGEIRRDIVDAQRAGEYELGGDMVSGWRALCGDYFFDALLAAEQVREALKYQESVQLRDDLRSGFTFGGVTFENYRGRTMPMTDGEEADPTAEASGTPFIADDEAYMVPVGADIFRTYFAPADFMEAVNTPGRPIYVKSVIDQELNRWVRLHSQSNPLCITLRPRAVVKLTLAS